jgi:hypothetical protein
MAARRQTRRVAKKATVQYVLVRGSRRNPAPMIATKKKGTLKRLARLLQTHFPTSRIRVQKVKLK